MDWVGLVVETRMELMKQRYLWTWVVVLVAAAAAAVVYYSR